MQVNRIHLSTCLILTFGFTYQLVAESSWASKAFSLFKSNEEAIVESDLFKDADELAKALRETLAVSAERALTDLAREGGFSSSTNAISLPASVEKLRKPLALVKQDHLLDDAEATMNRAAELGVAAAPGIVKNAINSLTLKDLETLWKGEDDAVTRFLESKSRSALSEKTLPLISKATEQSGATKTYKELIAAVPDTKGGLFSKIQSFTGIGASSFDLDEYINDQALDALFATMAAEEKQIRENPAAQTTDLLKRLFSSN
ncbi:MAG: DUF4197 domain-containing protein [Verrucomicrobiota bacterium]